MLHLTDGQHCAAVVDERERRCWPVAELLPGFEGDVLALIRDWERIAPRLAPSGHGRPLDEARCLAPLRPPRNLFCVGKNYRAHAAEFARSGFDRTAAAGEDAPEAPVIFTKTPQTVIGDGEPIPRHAGTAAALDYEAELAVVIGRGGRGIARERAMEHVWGYTIANDVTARDLQARHRQWFLGKSLDGFCPLGPWLVSADAFDPARARIRCWVDDELRQDACTGDLIFDIPTLIATLSAGIALQPGDLILTGTPAGVGIGFEPPRFLQAGQHVRIAIDGIGTLQNPIGA